jgi:AcrR family transcriptional regulator
MPPLPAPLADFATSMPPRLPKRERTRLQLVDAAIQVFSARGVTAASIQEIANVAGMTTGTVYNHFSTKDEIVQHVALWLGDTLCRRIADSHAGIPEGAERMAIGNRRYIWLAEQSPEWALLLLDVLPASPKIWLELRAYAQADLRLGIQQKSFSVPSEAAALDVISGTVTQAMRTVALGMAPANHGSAIAALVLRGLGMDSKAAQEVATRPLPPL